MPQQKPLSEAEFNAIADRVAQSAPTGLSEDQFDQLVQREIDKQQVGLGRRSDESWFGNLGRGAAEALQNPGTFIGNAVGGVKNAAQGLYSLAELGGKATINQLASGSPLPGAASVFGPYDLTEDTTMQGIGAAVANPPSTGGAILRDYKQAYVDNPGKTLYEDPFRVATDAAAFVAPTLRGASSVAGAANMPRMARAIGTAAEVADLPTATANMAKAVATRTAPRLQNAAREATRMSVGASRSDYYQKPAVRRAVDTQLAEGVYPTARGLRQIDHSLDRVQGQKANLFQQHAGVRPSTDVPNTEAVATRLRELDAAGTGPARQAEHVLDEWNTGTRTSAPTFTTQMQPSAILGPGGQPVMTPVQVPAGRQRLPDIDLATQEAIKNELGARLNPSFAKGQSVPYEPGNVEASRALYNDLRTNQEAVLPEVVPLNQRATGLHNLKAQLLKGPLAQQEQTIGSWPTIRAQIANAIEQNLGKTEAFAGHRFNGIAGRLGAFGTAPTILPQMVSPLIASDSAFVERPHQRVRRAIVQR